MERVLVSNIGINLMMKITGLNNLENKMQRAKQEVKNTKPLMNKAIIIIEMSEMKTFQMQGRPRWKKSNRAMAQGGMTLQDTARLKQSVTARSSNSIREIEGNTLTFGTKIVYAPTHQFGWPKKGIPKRPFLGVYEEDIKKLEEVFEEDIKSRLQVVVESE
jgi:phage gpG-like protein